MRVKLNLNPSEQSKGCDRDRMLKRVTYPLALIIINIIGVISVIIIGIIIIVIKILVVAIIILLLS